VIIGQCLAGLKGVGVPRMRPMAALIERIDPAVAEPSSLTLSASLRDRAFVVRKAERLDAASGANDGVPQHQAVTLPAWDGP